MQKSFAVAVSALVAACGLGAPSYPTFGETSYRIEGMMTPPDGGAPTQTVIYRNGPKMRVEASLPQYGQSVIVFDDSTNNAYILNPTSAVSAAPTTPTQTAATAAPTTPGATTTATTTETTTSTTTAAAQTTPGAPTTAAPTQAMGVAVRVPDADAPQPMEAAWASLGGDNATSVGECSAAGENGHEWRAKTADQNATPRIACITDDGIVLSLRENDQILWQATALDRGDQDAQLFGVPQGYTLIDPQAVTSQVSDTMDELDSVAGDQPAAP